MNKVQDYRVVCDCGSVELQIKGEPVVHAYCHCQDCRDLLDVPFNALTAWNEDQVQVVKGEEALLEYKYPGKEMKRYSCKSCGALLFNTNVYGWRLVSQALVRKCHAGELPVGLESDKHFYYEERVVDITDPLPKYLQGVDGPLYEAE